MQILEYKKERDEEKLMQMINDEDGWDYAEDDKIEKYKKALQESISYVAYEKDELCGFSRSMDDAELYIFVLDLLVKPIRRGKDIGKLLMEQLCIDYPDRTVFVLSDVDPYYEKLGYQKEGSIFQVKVS